MNSETPRPPILLLLTLFLLPALEFLHFGMITFAAGPIMGEIGASPEDYSLATATYACVAIITISKQRWLVDRLGWRRFIQLSLAAFVLGCVVSGFSITFRQFLLGRIIMGFGGAAFMTSGRVMVNLIPPSKVRFVGIKYFATGLSTGMVLAPWVASLAVSMDSWSAIFWVLALVATITGLVATVSLPTELTQEDLRTQSHPINFMLLTSGSFILLYFVQRSLYDFYSDLPMLMIGVGVAAFAVYYFFRRMYHYERPFLDLRELIQTRYLSGVALFSFCSVVVGANNYVLPVLMQQALGFSWYTIGLFQSMGLFAGFVAWLLMAWALPKWPGAKRYFFPGFCALTAFGWLLSQINMEANLWRDILPALAGNGIFIMMVMVTTATLTFRDVSHNETVLSHALQLKNMIAQFATALGLAIATIVLQWRSTEHYGVLNTRISSGNAIYLQVTQQLSELFTDAYGSSYAISLIAKQLSQQAMLLACLDYFSGVAILGFAGVCLIGLIRIKRRSIKAITRTKRMFAKLFRSNNGFLNHHETGRHL